MAVQNSQLLQTVSTITEALSGYECRSLSYLCGSLDTDSTVTGVKEMLKSKVTSSEMDKLLLLELLFELRRFDLLRNVFGTSRDEVERTLRHRKALSRFKVLMTNVSEDMASEDLNSMKFLLSSTLPRERIENAKNFLDVIVELEKLDKISSERVDLIEECLRNIGRVDLAKKVHLYQRSGENLQQQPPQHITQQPRPRVPVSIAAPIPCYSWRPPRQEQSNHHTVGKPQFTERKPAHVNREPHLQSALDQYNLSAACRGVCVIIDCVGNDGEMLEHAFKDLGFVVTLHMWLSVDNILTELRRVFKKIETHNADSFICCIISRGTSTNLLGTDSHCTGLCLDRVRRLFTAEECRMLVGKPKLFFIQSYSVPEVQAHPRPAYRDEDLETDGFSGPPECELIPTDADVFWSHCWTDERQLEQNTHHSVYLKALTDSLHKGQRRKTHLVDVHLEVNGTIYDHNKRNPREKYHIDLKHTLRKNLYFK
ncbi:CASP8 and FADD-like apoptosis regulator [Genypterus blacodes]|uniref:CASP8 and FADD-like apoptosis regulator n=1 Tax=Genypterus blacodes TaxID=154954 RepID=UPI003F759549